MGRSKGEKVKLKCPVCGNDFLRNPSWIKRNQAKGCLIYCSRECSDKNRKKVWKKYGKETSNYKNGQSSYRENALRIRGLICEGCGYDGKKYPGLIWVHHKDFAKRGEGLGRDNSMGNLEVLCVRCHLEKHYAIRK